MKNKVFSLLLVGLLLPLITACGKRAFTKGGYDDPNKVILLDDKFNENDMQLMSRDLVASLTEYSKIKNAAKPPIVMVGRVRNHTSEHIDMKSLTDKVRVELMKTGKFSFIDKDARDEIAEELEYEGGKYVDPKKAKKAGKQAGADFLITGDLSSNVQEVGKDKIVYYKITLNLVDLETNVMDWSDHKEIRKRYKKQSIGM